MTTASPSAVWAEVGRVTRRNSRTFWLGSRLMTGDRRRATLAVYAACRVGDDAADESARPVAALDEWRRGVDRAYDGRPIEPWERALAWAVRRFPLPRHAFEDLAAGLTSDLDVVRVTDLDELETYCYRVAGTVGLLMAPICGAHGPEARAAADRLGRAMQLTNCLRDVGEDLARDRIYLPADVLRAHGVTEAAMRSGDPGAGWVPAMEQLARHAEAGYEHGLAGLRHLRHHRTAVAYAALQYRGILTELRAGGWANLRRRAVVPGTRRLRMLPAAHVVARRSTHRPASAGRMLRGAA